MIPYFGMPIHGTFNANDEDERMLLVIYLH